MAARQLKFYQAINEGLDLSLAADSSVYLMGLGVPDPKGVFGTTLGLQAKYGPERVMDMPTAENGMTGVALGSALVGMRPVMVHQRIDFALLAIEQMVNQAAKWHYMFGGRMRVPLVIRMIIGRGWGQGPQHSQGLHAWFAHVPGLKVVMPATAYDAKGLLIASIEDNNPVLFLEHRWLYNTSGEVPEAPYRVPLGTARRAVEGSDVTIVGISFMTVEALRAVRTLATVGIRAEVIDVRSLRPLDSAVILESVRKTGHLIVADPAWKSVGFAAEVVALVAEQALPFLKAPPVRVAYPETPTPTTPALANGFYPRAAEIVAVAQHMLGRTGAPPEVAEGATPLDIPDPSFTGPF